MLSRVRGRDEEQALIGELVDATARGAGGVLLVAGAPGMGKTRMLAEATAVAGRAGVRAVHAEAFEAQRTVPFATLLTALLDGGVWTADRFDKGPDAAFWLLEEIHEALEAAALDGPLLIALDDLQAADAGTVLALRTLIPRTAQLPVLWVLALRPGDAGSELRALAAHLSTARTMDLHPLADAAVAQIVADRLQGRGDPALLDLAVTARGNPFLLVELLEGLKEEGRVHVRDGLARLHGTGLPRRLTDSMRERLDRLSAETCQVVRVAAVLGQRFTADQLAAVLHQRPTQLIDPIEEGLRADLLSESGDRLSFRHELLRQAVLGTLSRSVLRGLRREIAAVLLEQGAEAVQVAAQLAESADPGDAVAIDQLRRAARCLGQTDADAAARMSVRALELAPPDHPDRSALVVEAVAALHDATRHEEAEALGASALTGALSPDEEADVRLSLSARLLGHDLHAAEQNRSALALPGVSARLRAQHQSWLAYTLASAGPLAEAEQQVQRALTAGRRSQCGVAHAARNLCRLRRGHYQAVIEGLGESEHDPVVARTAEFHRAAALAALGRVDDALRLYRGGLERGRRERRAWLVSGWVAGGAHLHLLAGELADARADAEATESMGLHHVGTAVAQLSAFAVALHTGDQAELRRLTAAARRLHATAAPRSKRAAAWVLALAAEHAGDPHAAARWLDVEELPSDPANLVRVVRIGRAAGDARLARRAVAAAEAVERANPGTPFLAAVAAHARGLLHADAAELDRAVALLAGTCRPLPLAAALEDAGRFDEALEIYERVGATTDSARVTRALGGRRRVDRERPAEGWVSLTESELRVVRLVGRGATNREAAERLFLSPHTVSSHLRHAFTKLKINSRVELARLLHEHDLPASHTFSASLA